LNKPGGDAAFWDKLYAAPRPTWNTDRVEPELVRVLEGLGRKGGRVLELGCGTGANAVWMAANGFDVSAFDVSPLAIEQADARAAREGVSVRFFASSVSDVDRQHGTFDLLVDVGCYHSIRTRQLLEAYQQLLVDFTRSGSTVVVLAGNARRPSFPGPPHVSEEDLRSELGKDLSIVDLHEFEFDTMPPATPFLGWSCLLQRA